MHFYCLNELLSSIATFIKGAFWLWCLRPLQGEIMESILADRYVLAILPTGAGKSLCYQLPPVSPSANAAKPVVNSTAQATLEHWRAGKSMEDIAAARNLSLSTIEGHLAAAILHGEKIDPRVFYTQAEEEEMRKAMEGYDDEALKPVFEALDGRISYGKLKLFRAIHHAS